MAAFSNPSLTRSGLSMPESGSPIASLMRSLMMARSRKTLSLYVATSPGRILYGSSSNSLSSSSVDSPCASSL